MNRVIVAVFALAWATGAYAATRHTGSTCIFANKQYGMGASMCYTTINMQRCTKDGWVNLGGGFNACAGAFK